MIDQLTVCLPNRPGRLAKMCGLLGAWGVQIHAVMVADTTDFSIVRIVCDRPRSTARRLSELGFDAVTTRLVAVELENVPGALGRVLDRLASSDLNVEYAYCCSLEGRTVDLVKVSGEPLSVKLASCGLDFLAPSDLYDVDQDGEA